MMANTNSLQNRTGRYRQGGDTTAVPNRLGWWERHSFPKSTDDIPFKITAKYISRPDLIAFDVYGRSKLMWVILQYNNIIDINQELTEGRILALPSVRRLQTEILTSS
jgi:hypothetical protein